MLEILDYPEANKHNMDGSTGGSFASAKAAVVSLVLQYYWVAKLMQSGFSDVK